MKINKKIAVLTAIITTLSSFQFSAVAEEPQINGLMSTYTVAGKEYVNEAEYLSSSAAIEFGAQRGIIKWYNGTDADTTNDAKFISVSFDVTDSENLNRIGFYSWTTQNTGDKLDRKSVTNEFHNGPGNAEFDYVYDLSTQNQYLYRNGHLYAQYSRSAVDGELGLHYFQINYNRIEGKDRSSITLSDITVRTWNCEKDQLEALIYKERVTDDADGLYDEATLEGAMPQQYSSSMKYYMDSTMLLTNVNNAFNRDTNTFTQTKTLKEKAYNQIQIMSSIGLPMGSEVTKYDTVHFESLIKTDHENLDSSPEGTFRLKPMARAQGGYRAAGTFDMEADKEYKLDMLIDCKEQKLSAYIDGQLIGTNDFSAAVSPEGLAYIGMCTDYMAEGTPQKDVTLYAKDASIKIYTSDKEAEIAEKIQSSYVPEEPDEPEVPEEPEKPQINGLMSTYTVAGREYMNETQYDSSQAVVEFGEQRGIIKWYNGTDEDDTNDAKFVSVSFDVTDSENLNRIGCYSWTTQNTGDKLDRKSVTNEFHNGPGNAEFDYVYDLSTQNQYLYRNGHLYAQYSRSAVDGELGLHYFQINYNRISGKAKSSITLSDATVRTWNCEKDELEAIIYKERVTDDADGLYDEATLGGTMPQQYSSGMKYYMDGTMLLSNVNNAFDRDTNTFTQTKTLKEKAYNQIQIMSSIGLPMGSEVTKYDTVHFESIIKTNHENLNSSPEGTFRLEPMIRAQGGYRRAGAFDMEADREYKLDMLIDCKEQKLSAYIDGQLIGTNDFSAADSTEGLVYIGMCTDYMAEGTPQKDVTLYAKDASIKIYTSDKETEIVNAIQAKTYYDMSFEESSISNDGKTVTIKASKLKEFDVNKYNQIFVGFYGEGDKLLDVEIVNYNESVETLSAITDSTEVKKAKIFLWCTRNIQPRAIDKVLTVQ